MSNTADELIAALERLDAAKLAPDPNYQQSIWALREPGWLYDFWENSWGMDVRRQPHGEMANFIEEALGDCRFNGSERTLIMLGVPRGTFKTTGVSEATPVAVLTRNPDAKILLDGFRHSVAKARLRAIRRKIELDDRLDDRHGTKLWKPAFRTDTWNDEEIIVTIREDTMSREASVATAGVDRSMNSQHFDLIIPDDVVTDTNVMTPEGRDRVDQHIQDLLPILNPGGVLIIVFTTWHPDDAYMRRIKIDEDRLRRGLEPKFKKLIHGCYDGPNGLYFPPFIRERDEAVLGHSYEFLEEQRETMGARKFAAQYLLKPIADEDKTFDMGKMRLREFMFFTTSGRQFGGVIRDIKSEEQFDVETAIAWDPMGRKPGRTTNTHGITVSATDRMNRWWIPEAVGLKLPPDQIINHLCNMIIRYKPWTISIEDTFGSGLWLDLLQSECARRGIVTTFTEFTTGGVPKEERIVLLQPRWEHGDMILLANELGMPVHLDFIKQIDAFTPIGRGESPDILDSMVQHLRLHRKPAEFEGFKDDPNPPDPEAIARRKRQQAEGHGESQAGLFGPVWIT